MNGLTWTWDGKFSGFARQGLSIVVTLHPSAAGKRPWDEGADMGTGGKRPLLEGPDCGKAGRNRAGGFHKPFLGGRRKQFPIFPTGREGTQDKFFSQAQLAQPWGPLCGEKKKL